MMSSKKPSKFMVIGQCHRSKVKVMDCRHCGLYRPHPTPVSNINMLLILKVKHNLHGLQYIVPESTHLLLNPKTPRNTSVVTFR